MSAESLYLSDGSRVAVVGGGPAGAFFSYFLLEMAQAVNLNIELDIFEPRDFARQGPAGCNMCGGIVSESLVQSLAAEGILLPTSVVQRSIDSYYLHMDVGRVRIETPLREMRLAAVHRGGGPRNVKVTNSGGLDGHLLALACGVGANLQRARVDDIRWENGAPVLHAGGVDRGSYDLVACAVGVNSPGLKLFESAAVGYVAPPSTKAYICEFWFGREVVEREFGDTMHVFLLNLPRLEFAAFIPKGAYVTMCMLGEDIDKKLVTDFLNSREVRECLPPNWSLPDDFCHCSPKISVGSARAATVDRVVFVGDCGSTRLYKDGIGAAYRTAKAAARTAVFRGVSADAFRRYYTPICRRIDHDNDLGKLVFFVSRLLQQRKYARRGMWRMVSQEQGVSGGQRRLSSVLWDTFTGSAPYASVLRRTMHPAFVGSLAWNTLRENFRAWKHSA